MTVTQADPLAFYASIGAALFPIPAGRKEPFGIVSSFVTDCSRDPAQWTAWRTAHPGCNFGIVAGASRLIIVDIDTKQGRDAAWALWCELCASWGVPSPFLPHVQSARGGWHVLFACDAPGLRQPDAIRGAINIRAGNGFTVAAGSWFNDEGTARPYVLLSDFPPYPAPAALVAHCTRAERVAGAGPVVGARDAGDVARLIQWLAERDQFDAYEDWASLGMALKIEFGDTGLGLWEMATWDEARDALPAKWTSFASEPDANSVTLNTFLDRAHRLGWRGQVRKSAAAMFDGVAQLAAAAGASLPVGGVAPVPDSGVPMLAGQAKLAELAAPIVAEFMSATAIYPSRPMTHDFPTLPESCSGHGLYEPLRSAIDKLFAMAEAEGPKLRAMKLIDVCAVLSLVHRDAFEAIIRRLRAFGIATPDQKIKLAGAALAERVERCFVTQDDWIYDGKGQIEQNNSDNVAVFLGIIGAEVRWNGWLERAEIRGDEWRVWTYVDDTVIAKLRTRANRTKTRFVPAREFFWESLTALAHANPIDPVLDRLSDLEAAWDGVPRLVTWLSAVCGVPCDPYHQAVGRNVIGGMVRRARNPGCKHDEMAVFYGPQGHGKSTLLAIIADMGQSSLPALVRGGGRWFTDTVRLGDEAKELILSLAGICVAEIGEMGSRAQASANHIKAMVSRQVDRGRTAYARAVSDRPRRNIFAGTTNDDKPLSDPTGNRRFLPVAVFAALNLDWLRDHVEQIVGEAAALESAGHDFAIPRNVWSIAAEQQEAARELSDTEIKFADWFGVTDYTQHAFITASDLSDLVQLAGLRHGNGPRGAIMRRMGFVDQIAKNIDGKTQRIWLRGIRLNAVRYVPGTDQSGRARVTIRNADGAPGVPGAR